MSRSGPRRPMNAKSTGPADAKDDPTLPVVALVGRPNVGKSSLFNRLVGGRPAIVEDRPGVTRDRRYGVCEWDRRTFRVCDTGGLDPSAEGVLGAMREQTLRAVDEADVLVFVVDATEGVTGVDQDVARVLRRSGRRVLVAANKVDSGGRDALAAEVFRLGFPDVFAISAAHGRGVGDLLDAALGELGDKARALPTAPKRDRGQDEEAEEATPEEVRAAEAASFDRPIRLAFAGKPNAGKSSLVNRLLGEDRVLVHDQPGTTRDPIDTPFRAPTKKGDREFVLVDTAGIRRRKVVKSLTEAVSAKMARDQIDRADVVALVVDLAAGASDDDAKLAGAIEEAGRGLVVVLNKADLVPRAELDQRLTAAREVLGFVSWAPFVVTSARSGRGVHDLVDAAARVYGQWHRRVATAELNRHFAEWVGHRAPPSGPAGRHVKLYYVTQAQVAPPTFFVSSNLPSGVTYPYRRYLANQIRKAYGFEGTPVKLAVRGHKGKANVRSGASRDEEPEAIDAE